MDALARTRFSGYERNVLDVLFRKTYGWGKSEDAISLSQFVDATGIRKPHIVRTLTRLVWRCIVTKIGNVTQNGNDKSATYVFNERFEEWLSLPKMVTLPKMVPTIDTVFKDSVSIGERVQRDGALPKPVTLPKPVMDPGVSEVLAYLNAKVKRNFTNPGQIPARLKSYSIADCKAVIDKKCKEWLGTEMAKHLDPVTLFRVGNFDRYLNQVDTTTRPRGITDYHAWDDVKGW